MDAIGQLTGRISHDFNNILTVVISNLELILRHERVHPLDRERAEAALQAATRGGTLTQRLLAFARKQPLRPRATDVGALVGSMASLLRRSCGENIELSLAVPPQLPGVMVDPNQLENALLNLVLNARDAMSGRGRLLVTADGPLHIPSRMDPVPGELTAGTYVALAVEDNGAGMEPELLGRIFEPFFTTKVAGQGTGLGLSMVYGFAKQSGGHVTVRSRPGAGTRVVLYLPAVDLPPPVKEDRQAATPPAARRSAQVLVVEDDALVRLAAIRMLREFGYGVHEAASGAEALEVLERHPEVELLFTDIGLPGMDGYQLAAEARRRRPEIGVVLATGYDRSLTARDGAAAERTCFLGKPYLAADLEQALLRLLPPGVH